MRRASASLLIALLLVSAAPLAQADSKGVISCLNADLTMMPANWDVGNQSCVRVDLGELEPGETLSFDITSDELIDILLFSVNSISVYQNEQAYRSDSIWESDSVFESFNGTGEWHWTVPDDRVMTRWYLVLDNLAHPQDGGGGAQGGTDASVSLDSGIVSPAPFTLVDTIVRLDVGGHSILHGPFLVDAGTQVRIDAMTMEGAPDVFLMTESQVTLYEAGGTAASRVGGTDMLLIMTERHMVWLVPETYEGTDLYLVVDNRAGPSGGGAGTQAIATTVTLSLTPVLEPTIGGEVSLDVVDVGAIITLDASETPNRSGQIPASGFKWDTNADGVDDTIGSTVNVSWSDPTNITVRLTVVSTDGRSASVYQEIEVSDISEPEVSIGVTAVLERTYGDNVVLSGQVSDNWGIETIEWLVDDQLVRSNAGDDEGATVYSHSFDSSYAAGSHTVTLRATDLSGRVAEDTASITLYDSTSPVIGIFVDEISLQIGQTFRFEANVTDAESNDLLFFWDFDGSVDSDEDGDPRNDADSYGNSVLWSYENSGPQSVVCHIENDAGLVSEFEILVNVMSGSEGDGGYDLMTMGMIGLAALIGLVLIVMLSWRIISNRRLAALVAQQEETEEAPTAAPSTDEQKAMWGGGGGTGVSAPESTPQIFGDVSSGMSGATADISTAMGEPEGGEIDPDIAALLESARQSESAPASSAANDLLSAFESDDTVEREDVDFSHEGRTEDGTSTWSPGEDGGEVFQPVDESEPEAQDRTVRQNCSSCEKMFEVDLPEGVDTARTACPHCGSIESISLG